MQSLWKVDDVAELLNVKPRTIREWTARSRIPYIRLNGSIRYEPDRIRRWALEECSSD